jgi:hypothetical protein
MESFIRPNNVPGHDQWLCLKDSKTQRIHIKAKAQTVFVNLSASVFKCLFFADDDFPSFAAECTQSKKTKNILGIKLFDILTPNG